MARHFGASPPKIKTKTKSAMARHDAALLIGESLQLRKQRRHDKKGRLAALRNSSATDSAGKRRRRAKSVASIRPYSADELSRGHLITPIIIISNASKD